MTEEMTNVLVVRVPRAIDDIDICLEHIRRGLHDGILILGADVSYTVEKFPPLGSVKVEQSTAPEGSLSPEKEKPVPDSGTGKAAEPHGKAATAQLPSPASPTLQVRGAGAAEKKRIFTKLCAYRDKTGAGWARRVADMTKPQVSYEIIRSLVTDGAVISLDTWRIIDRALDKFEASSSSDSK